MKILVTGAGGFVGGHLLPHLIRLEHDVIACSHTPMAGDGFPVEIFDILDAGRVHDVLHRHKPEGVIHLAGQASVPRSWRSPEETYRTNIVGTTNLLESLRNHPATRVLLIGSAQVYGASVNRSPLKETAPLLPTSPYAVSKAAQELLGQMYFRGFNLPVVATRSFNHTGPGQSPEYAVGSFCSQIVEILEKRRNPSIRVGRLDSVRDFLDVRDVVNAYRLLIESGSAGEVYNVSSGQGSRIGDLLKTLLDVAGLGSTVDIIEDQNRQGDVDMLVGDNSKIGSATGWGPKIELDRSLVETLESYKREPQPAP